MRHEITGSAHVNTISGCATDVRVTGTTRLSHEYQPFGHKSWRLKDRQECRQASRLLRTRCSHPSAWFKTGQHPTLNHAVNSTSMHQRSFLGAPPRRIAFEPRSLSNKQTISAPLPLRRVRRNFSLLSHQVRREFTSNRHATPSLKPSTHLRSFDHPQTLVPMIKH